MLATIRALRSAKVPDAQIVDAIVAMEEERLASKRATDTERQRRHRASRMSQPVTHVTRDERDNRDQDLGAVSTEKAPDVDPPRARVEGESLTQESKKNNSHTNTRAKDLAEFKAELKPHLDAERIEAIVKLRRAKRGQLTGYAARLFIADAEACGLPVAEAANTCVSRNWITVKPEYFAGRNRPNGHSPPESPVTSEVGDSRDVFKKWREEQDAKGG